MDTREQEQSLETLTKYLNVAIDCCYKKQFGEIEDVACISIVNGIALKRITNYGNEYTKEKTMEYLKIYFDTSEGNSEWNNAKMNKLNGIFTSFPNEDNYFSDLIELAFAKYCFSLLRLEIQKIRQKYLYRVEAEKVIVDYWSRVNSSVKDFSTKSTPFHLACKSCQPRIVEEMFKAFDHESMYIANLPDSEASIPLFSCWENLLREKKNNENERSHLLSQKKRMQIVELMLRKGALFSHVNKMDKNLFQLIPFEYQNDVQEILKISIALFVTGGSEDSCIRRREVSLSRTLYTCVQDKLNKGVLCKKFPLFIPGILEDTLEQSLPNGGKGIMVTCEVFDQNSSNKIDKREILVEKEINEYDNYSLFRSDDTVPKKKGSNKKLRVKQVKIGSCNMYYQDYSLLDFNLSLPILLTKLTCQYRISTRYLSDDGQYTIYSSNINNVMLDKIVITRMDFDSVLDICNDKTKPTFNEILQEINKENLEGKDDEETKVRSIDCVQREKLLKILKKMESSIEKAMELEPKRRHCNSCVFVEACYIFALCRKIDFDVQKNDLLQNWLLYPLPNIMKVRKNIQQYCTQLLMHKEKDLTKHYKNIEKPKENSNHIFAFTKEATETPVEDLADRVTLVKWFWQLHDEKSEGKNIEDLRQFAQKHNFYFLHLLNIYGMLRKVNKFAKNASFQFFFDNFIRHQKLENFINACSESVRTLEQILGDEMPDHIGENYTIFSNLVRKGEDKCGNLWIMGMYDNILLQHTNFETLLCKKHLDDLNNEADISNFANAIVDKILEAFKALCDNIEKENSEGKDDGEAKDSHNDNILKNKLQKMQDMLLKKSKKEIKSSQFKNASNEVNTTIEYFVKFCQSVLRSFSMLPKQEPHKPYISAYHFNGKKKVEMCLDTHNHIRYHWRKNSSLKHNQSKCQKLKKILKKVDDTALSMATEKIKIKSFFLPENANQFHKQFQQNTTKYEKLDDHRIIRRTGAGIWMKSNYRDIKYKNMKSKNTGKSKYEKKLSKLKIYNEKSAAFFIRHIVKPLIDAGHANSVCSCVELRCVDTDNWARRSYFNICEILRWGPNLKNVSKVDNSILSGIYSTLLISAAGYKDHSKSFPLVKLLISKGVDINVVDPSTKFSSFEKGAQQGAFRLCNYLVRHGAAVSVPAIETIIDYVITMGFFKSGKKGKISEEDEDLLEFVKRKRKTLHDKVETRTRMSSVARIDLAFAAENTKFNSKMDFARSTMDYDFLLKFAIEVLFFGAYYGTLTTHLIVFLKRGLEKALEDQRKIVNAYEDEVKKSHAKELLPISVVFIDAADKHEARAIHYACMKGHLNAVKALHSCHASLNVKTSSKSHQFRSLVSKHKRFSGYTPLALAVQNKHTEVVEYLQNNGADPFGREDLSEAVMSLLDTDDPSMHDPACPYFLSLGM